MTPIGSEFARHMPRLLAQLVPAALVAIVGTVLLGNLAKAPNRSPDTAPVAIEAEAVFTATPRASAEPELTARDESVKAVAVEPAHTAVKPRPLMAASPSQTTPPQTRKAANEQAATTQVAVASAPLAILPPVEQPEARAASAGSESSVMNALRGATASIRRLPHWAADSMSGWFAEDAPPRPPASIPMQEFQASM